MAKPSPAYPVAWPAVEITGTAAPALAGLGVTALLATYRVRFELPTDLALIAEAVLRDGTEGVVGVRPLSAASLGARTRLFEVEGWFPTLSSLRAAVESALRRGLEAGIIQRGSLLLLNKAVFERARVVEQFSPEAGLEIVIPPLHAAVTPRAESKTASPLPPAPSSAPAPANGAATNAASLKTPVNEAMARTNATAAGGIGPSPSAMGRPPSAVLVLIVFLLGAGATGGIVWFRPRPGKALPSPSAAAACLARPHMLAAHPARTTGGRRARECTTTTVAGGN